ncbi:MAG: PEGA domain-containing protein [Candidatus Omnitrophica bacterium]|nr:PEGA domain-containing protein [Candidatus Omnitrophota bacterium]MDE2008632.1 PEGA domain-containing protein [Candidatus Omnitrophota bacterium]MDE2214985.1 PEGA domain-containing protein [Candidatus Omnitrophota bacterium]
MLWLRKVTFYIFALIYLVLCPLIVARMLGFVINPLTHRLVKTGLIYVSTNPPGAAVYADGRRARQRTPMALRDLTPGEHFIRLELAGYNDWKRHIPVKGNKATVASGILLIPQEWSIQTISEGPYQNIFPTGRDILVAANPLLKDISIIYTAPSLQGTPLFLAHSIYAGGKLVCLYNAPPSPFILLQADIKDKSKFLWINLNEKPPVIEDVSDLFPEIPSRVSWNNADDADLFAFYPSSIYRINVNAKAIYPQDPQDLPEKINQRPVETQQEAFLINNNHDLIVRRGRWIRLYPQNDFGGSHVYAIAQSKPSTNIYFESKTGELFYLDETGRLCAVQILPHHFNQGG